MSVGEISEAQKWCDEARKILGLTRLDSERRKMGSRSDEVVKLMNEMRKKLKESRKQDGTANLEAFEKRYVAISKRALQAQQNDDKEGVRIESEQLSLLKKDLAAYLASPERKKAAEQKAQAKKVEVDHKITEMLREVRETWTKAQQTCEKGLRDLEPLSQSEHKQLSQQFQTLMSQKPTEQTRDAYEQHTGQLETLNKAITTAVNLGKKAAKDAAGKLKAASQHVDSCDEICTAEQKRNLYDEVIHAEGLAQPSGDYIEACRIADQVVEAAKQLKSKQEEAKKKYEQYHLALAQPLDDLRKVASRTQFLQFSTVTNEALLLTKRNDFDGAIALLEPLPNKVLNAIGDETKKLEKWQQVSGVLKKQITDFVNKKVSEETSKDIKPWTSKYKAEVMAEVEDILWKAENLRTFDECLDALNRLWDVRLNQKTKDEDWGDDVFTPGSIDADINEIEISQGEARELADRLIDQAESVDLLLQQLIEKIRSSDPDKIDSVDALRLQVKNVRYSVQAGNVYLPLNQMKITCAEGKLTLDRISKDAKLYLSGSPEGTIQLQDYVAVQMYQKEMAALDSAWNLARTQAEEKLTQLAQHGGTEYFNLLGIFEKADTDIVTAKQTFTEFLEAIALHPKEPDEGPLNLARDQYNTTTAAIGPTFLGRVDTAINSAAVQLLEAKRLFGLAKNAYNTANPRTGMLGKGTKLADSFIEKLRQEAAGALTYETSTNASAITSAAEILNRLAAQLREVAQDFTNGEDVAGSFKNIDKQLKDLLVLIQTPALKQVDPERQKQLRERWDKLKLGIVGKSSKEALEMILKCRDRDAQPSVTNALKILEIRGKTPALLNEVNQKVATLVGRVNAKANKKLPTNPPNLGTITSEISGCDNLIKAELRAGAVEAAYNRLIEIRDTRLNVPDDKLEALAQSANTAIEKARQDEIDNVKKKDELTKSFEGFKKNEFNAAKNFVSKSGGDKKQFELLQNGVKAIEQSLKSGELISAEEQFEKMKQIYADIMNSGRAKSTKALLPLAKLFAQKVETVNQSLVALKTAVRDAFKDDSAATGQELQDTLAAIPDSLASHGIASDAFEKPLVLLDNAQGSLESRRAARETALQLVRDYKRIVANDPVFALLRNNKFGVPIPSGPLFTQLRVIEDAVVVRT